MAESISPVEKPVIRLLVFLLLCLLLFPSFSKAAGFPPLEKMTLSGYVETGKRSQSEDFEEEENDLEYNFQNYHLKFKFKHSGIFNYEVGSFIYNKAYKENDSLDNISKIFKAGGTYYISKQKRGSLRLNIRLKYKEKRFNRSPSSEYDQSLISSKIIYDKKDLYSISLSTGINNYDYINADGRDQLKVFSKLGVKRYLFGRNLLIISSYRFEIASQKMTGRRKNKNDLMFGFDYKFKNPLIYKISARTNLGQKDTKDDDARDEDFDYKYRQFHIKTKHRLNPELTTRLKYQYFKKDYLTADLDHSGYYLLNKWRYEILADKKQVLYFNITAKHKDVNYVIKSDRNYNKESLGITGTYKRKKGWKASVSFKGNFYDFKDSEKDKNRFYARVLFEKLFPEKGLVLSIKLKYKYTDNKQANDTEDKSVRLAFKYKL